ncbi:MAG TPA: dTDP-4-dehydrorhamnose reductase [Pseudolysinimonas sp.]|nr:dTDP-4-dehydrorhamnose reductase [Pseudolysinimonas sp.]
MSYVILGAGGMLGTDLVAALAGRSVRAFTRADLDITDAAAVGTAIEGAEVIINAAAYTRVDDAESHEDEALAINGTAAGNAAAAAAALGAKFVQISTDYVFDGTATEPYAEDAPINPASAYGRTKAAGEQLVRAAHPGPYIVRTAWLYGQHGPNFARTMLSLATQRDTVSVVTDQVGQPTWTRDLADQIVTLLDSEAPAGTYHGTNSGRASWFEFAQAVFREAGLDPERVLPTDSSTFVRPAPRPAFSVLGHSSWAQAAIPEMRPWQDALAAANRKGALAL